MREGPGVAGGEHGAVMMIVLMAVMLIGAVTITVMQVISGDVGGGVEALEADQVFNIAQAGLHYAIGKLNTAVANSYVGETRAITNGTTTLGTALVTVSCIDTGGSPNPNGCSGAYAKYRRIVSVGSLPVSGPTRTIVPVI